ncbi:tetratricopeptide repeat protein [Fulvivirgaceae bacterium BMA10]|uniref:Tetratricopeptide repeat protein n=1 Tax=Splendidivirga corallicola TaxID=3051826 RepID=A0ABT8KJ16_9BACT|nr:tetratricopeptide repeat protein [Fulvivirgaceae bacterium BMA10]
MKTGHLVFILFFFQFNIDVFCQIEKDTLLANEALRKAQTLLDSLSYEKAIPHFQKAGKIYKQYNLWDQFTKSAYDHAFALKRLKEKRQSVFMLNDIIKIAQTKSKLDPLFIAGVYKEIASIEYDLGNYDEAEVNFKEALKFTIRELGEDSPKAASIYNRLASVYRRRSLYDKALDYAQKALRIAKNKLEPTDPDVSGYYHSLGYVYYKMSRLNEAIYNYKKSLKLRIEAFGQNHRYVADSYLNLGSVYDKKGDYENSIHHFEKALKIYNEILGNEHTMVASCYNNLGIISRKLGDLERSRLYHEVALNIKVKAHGVSHPRVAKYYYNLGLANELKGNYDKALEYYQQSLDIEIEAYGKDHPNVAGQLGAIGYVYFEQKKYDRALELLNKGLEINIRTVGTKDRYTPAFLANIGEVYYDIGKYEQAIGYYQKSLTMSLDIFGKYHPDISNTHLKLARSYSALGDRESALLQSQLALTTISPAFHDQNIEVNPNPDIIFDKVTLLKALQIKGNVLTTHAKSDDLNELLNAFNTYEIAISIIDELRNSYALKNSYQQVTSETSDFISLFETAIEVANRLSTLTDKPFFYKDRAFAFAEKSKSVLLLMGLQDTHAKTFAGVPSTIISKENEIKADLIYFKTLVQDEEIKGEEADIAKLTDWKKQIFNLNKKSDSLLNVIQEDHHDYFRLRYNKDVASINQVQSILSENNALIEYFIGHKAIYIFSITNSNSHITKIEKDPAFFTHLEKTRMLLAGSVSRPLDYAKTTHTLYQYLFKPIQDLIKSYHITLVPDGQLGYIPFDLLVKTLPGQDIPSFSSLDYLIRDYQFNYAYSATILFEALSESTSDRTNQYLAFAPTFNDPDEQELFDQTTLLASNNSIRNQLVPLEGAKEEIEAISSFVKGKFYHGNVATENLFKENINDYGILHLATHAIVDDENPMNSRLLFTSNNDSLEDGNLYTWELYGLKLKAQLAVLSACNTGVGKIRRGEGVMSLGRAFSYAGCSSIIMSLWPAQDIASATIMTDFYKGISKGHSKDKALRDAKLKYLQNADDLFTHPFHWGSFISQGDPRPIKLDEPFNYWWLLGPMVIILSFFLYRKKKFS